MRAYFYLQVMLHRLTKDRSGQFANAYLQIVVYIAIATVLGLLVFGDNLDNILSDVRRALLGNNVG